MNIPDYQSIMLPLLKFLSDRKEYSFREAVEYLADLFNLDEQQLRQFLPSEKQYVFDNRVA